jgi:hypothetical protein
LEFGIGADKLLVFLQRRGELGGGRGELCRVLKLGLGRGEVGF